MSLSESESHSWEDDFPSGDQPDSQLLPCHDQNSRNPAIHPYHTGECEQWSPNNSMLQFRPGLTSVSTPSLNLETPRLGASNHDKLGDIYTRLSTSDETMTSNTSVSCCSDSSSNLLRSEALQRGISGFPRVGRRMAERCECPICLKSG